MTSKWRQKCSPLQIIEPLTEKTWGQGCVIFDEWKNKERNGETPLKTRKYFEWIIKQLLNSSFVGYEEFCRFQISASVDNTLLDLQNSSYPTQPHSIINKYRIICSFYLLFKAVAYMLRLWWEKSLRLIGAPALEKLLIIEPAVNIEFISIFWRWVVTSYYRLQGHWSKVISVQTEHSKVLTKRDQGPISPSKAWASQPNCILSRMPFSDWLCYWLSIL